MATHSSTADYISRMAMDLAEMARDNGLNTLEFLLEMVAIEALDISPPENCRPARYGPWTANVIPLNGKIAGEKSEFAS
jgi:hypothetical protein